MTQFINRDTNLRLQYLAGMGLNLHEEDYIYRKCLPIASIQMTFSLLPIQYKQELIQKPQ